MADSKDPPPLSRTSITSPFISSFSNAVTALENCSSVSLSNSVIRIYPAFPICLDSTEITFTFSQETCKESRCSSPSFVRRISMTKVFPSFLSFLIKETTSFKLFPVKSVPATALKMSPACIPAFCAGPPAVTLVTAILPSSFC